MRIRGDRTCRDCGATWSYSETASVPCPECGSMRSTGSGERSQHTDRATALDLTGPRETAAEDDLESALDEAADACLLYLRRRGFVDSGSLQDLDEAYVHAQELRHAAIIASSRLELSDREDAYLLSLLTNEVGDRPPVDAVPASFRAPRALAIATAVRDYRDELGTWLDDAVDRPDAAPLLESLGDHVKRIRALDGEVPPAQVEDLLVAARVLGRYYRDGDDALETATEALDRLG